MFQADSRLYGWQILLLIEGLATVGFAILVSWAMPWHPSTASFLNDRQKEIARLRLLKDGSSSTKTKFDRKAFFKPLKDPKFYAYGAIGQSRRGV